MATNNITFPIYNADGTPFNGLVLRNATFDSVVMSLGDKITGDVYYKDNTLAVTMSEYIEYKRNEDSEAVKFVLVSPPTVVREGIVSDNSELRGMTKYSFVFYHPMYAVSNFPFTDVAVSSNEEKFRSDNKTFVWSGNLFNMVAKLNKNLQGTQWIVGTNIEHYEQDGVTETSMWQKAAKIPDEPLSFDKTYVSEVLKTSYETWEIPFIVDQIAPTDARYAQGKRFLILFGTPSNEILDDQGQPYIFRFGQGVGLKNNSRTPKNNKIVTRIVGYGSENNIPFGYPQIQWFGDQTWKYTVRNDLSAKGSLPIYKGILGGQYVNLIKHPFTRKTLMPSVYRETLFNKVSPYMPDGTQNPNFDPTIELVDYYDADSSYVNTVVEGAESVEIHQFEDIKPEFTEHSIVGISAYDSIECISISEFNAFIQSKILASNNENEKSALQNVYDNLFGMADSISNIGGSYTFLCKYGEETEYTNGVWQSVKYTSSGVSFTYNVYNGSQPPSVDVEWDDTMDDDGKYKQQYFKMTLPQLDFDLYACASITEEMKINMRSGACIGCTFPIYVDWDDYKKNFYDSDGNFLPDGEQRDLTKYPKTNLGQVTFVVNKDLDTFGTLMPNTYQKPHSGDEFVILGISLPTTYVTNAEARLDDAAKEYMRENNVHYYEYPLKLDEHFLATHVNILSQIRNNTIVRFQYGGELPMALYVKQITVKYSGVLPTYDITLTDDVEIVLNQIGQVTDDVSRMRVQVSELQKYYSENIIQAINEKLSKVVDDVCQGRITFQQGLDSIGSAIFHDELRSPDFTSGLYTGRGWRVDQLGNAELESLRVRSYLEIVELLVNRMQAQEGDTMFSDNDQIDKVDKIEDGGNVSYILSLKEKWSGYVTSQMYGNILKGIINTLAAKQSGVSDYESTSVEVDGENKYYTSWMRVIATHNTDNTLSPNQIRVVLYGDNEVPAQKNFEPCELMTIARWGCVDYSDPSDPNYETIKASIVRRQRMFMISTTDGRVVKYTGVDSPILNNGNYGVTIGELPEFVKNYPSVRSILNQVGEHTDWLYAQGIVVGNLIKVDIEGRPEVNIVDCGEWVNGSRMAHPTPRNGIYLYNEWNNTTQQYETHDVWHNNAKWRCLQHQPVTSGGITKYYEPTDSNSAYWRKLEQGLSGGETIMQYALSAHKTSIDGTSQTPPADISSSDWQDAPMATTTQKPYLWSKVQKKDGNGNNVGSATYIRLTGEEGKDGLSPNPNILLRTVFDRGIDKVSEKWSFDSSYVSIDPNSDTVVEGRKSIRLNSQNNVNGVSFSQSVLGKIKPNTWYTVSFNAFHAPGGDFVMSFNNLIGGSRHLIYDGNVIVDGVARTIVDDSCNVVINADWGGARHTVTFKTRSSEHISTTRLDFVFWQGYSSTSNPPHSQTAICMPKLEIGEVATAYMANEDDLRGEKGDEGTRGKIGRFFYYAGEFDSSNTTQTFVVNDAQAPYFSHGVNASTGLMNCHVYNPTENGTFTMAQMWANSSQSWNNAPWEVMTNDFKYIITEAIFASFAHFDSAIINGDWMLSQHGTKNGVASTSYTDFDPAHPNDNTGTNFIPNYCVDLLTGETYQNAAHISGNVQATGGYFKGIVAYGSVRTPFVNGDKTWDWNEQDKDICDNFFVVSGGSYSTVYPIPNSAANSGRTLTVVNKSSYAAHLRCEHGGNVFVSGSAPSDWVSIPAKTMMQLLGLGTETTFYGWMVINKQTYDFGSIFS